RLIRLDAFGKRRLFRLPCFQQRRDTRQLLLIEAGACVTDIDELAVFVHAEQQRAEVRPRVARFGPAGDDELLLVLQLELAPCGAATPGFIERAGFFRDQSFPAFFLRARVQLARVARDLLADPNHSGWRSAEAPDRLLEAAATLGQRQPRQ